MESKIGEKIKNFRKKSGMKQLELEIAINGSSGFVSRIESGKINPSKKTIFSIAKVLKLNDIEVASLFSINNDYLIKTLSIINNFSEKISVESIIQTAVDDITMDLDYIGSALFMFEGDKLFFKSIGTNKVTKRVVKMFPVPYQTLYIDEGMKTKNLLFRSAVDKKIYTSDNYLDFSDGLMNRTLAKTVAQLFSFHRGLVIPLVAHNKSIGSILFAKRETTDYSYEIPVLEALCKQIAIMVMSVEPQKYKK